MSGDGQGSGARLTRAQKLFRWWYISIGLGFALLGIRAWLEGDTPWLIGLRFVIAAGFVVLGLLFFSRRER